MGINEERYGADALPDDDFPIVGDEANIGLEDDGWEGDEPTGEDENTDGYEFGIERSEPPPPPVKRKYPFHKMRIGDSFEVRVKPDVVAERGLADAMRMTRSALSSSASAFNRAAEDRKMVVRKTGKTTLRCWCVDPDY